MSGVEFYRHALGVEEEESIALTLRSLFLTLGPRTAEFEQRFARYLEVEHVVGTNSCSAGLLIALAAFGIGPGDEVITTPMTFVATANAILHLGATPVFADVDPSSGLIDPVEVERRISERTRAVLPVHLYGQMADMRAIRELARQHDLFVIEDAAHAVEAARDGLRPGQLGDAAVFSFYATKNLTAGDGGAVAVRSSEIAERLRRLRNHGITKDAATRYGQQYRHWDMLELGYKAAMNDLDAALLLPQLDKIEARRQRRCELVERYRRNLSAEPLVAQVGSVGQSAHHLYTVQVPGELRDRLLAGLGERGVGCAVNYRSLHTLSYFRARLHTERDDFPHAARFGEQTLTLPLWPDMPFDSVDRACEALISALREREPLREGTG
jgi:dTDP-4-amino-4,6-dideoxygalactose transaminase